MRRPLMILAGIGLSVILMAACSFAAGHGHQGGFGNPGHNPHPGAGPAHHPDHGHPGHHPGRGPWIPSGVSDPDCADDYTPPYTPDVAPPVRAGARDELASTPASWGWGTYVEPPSPVEIAKQKARDDAFRAAVAEYKKDHPDRILPCEK
jgi:hypothetical protein